MKGSKRRKQRRTYRFKNCRNGEIETEIVRLRAFVCWCRIKIPRRWRGGGDENVNSQSERERQRGGFELAICNFGNNDETVSM